MRIRVYPQYGSYGSYGYGYRRRSRGYGYGGSRISIRPVGGWGNVGRAFSERQMMRQEIRAERFAQRSVRGIRQAMRAADAMIGAQSPLGLGYGAAAMPGFGLGYAAGVPGYGYAGVAPAYGYGAAAVSPFGYGAAGLQYTSPLMSAYTGAGWLC